MTEASSSLPVNIPDPLKRKGIIFVLSAPSGTGKSTICQSLRQSPDFSFIVSYTTRTARAGETDGEDYRFVGEPEFVEKIDDGFFLEHANVHGLRYGTPKQDVLDRINEGKDVVLDIDVEGARQIRALQDPEIQEALVDIFILPPSMEELEKRLRKRGTESNEQISVRLGTALREIPAWNCYRYTLVSESMEEDLTKMRAIIKAERYRTSRLLEA
ncbi:MAG: guanylate kinase [Verrucomicrobiota bacterium]